MIATNEVELLENSSVKLKITVSEEQIKKEYDKLVKEYCKNVQIKGFRKGKVPPNILIQKFGDALKDETASNVINKSLEDTLATIEQKPLPYSQPALLNEEEMKFELDRDFSYEISYDTYPSIELGSYTGLEVTEPKVEVTDEDMDRELKRLQEQNAMVVEKKDGIVEKDSIIKIDYVELDDEGNEVAESKRSDYTFTVGTKYNLYELDDDLIGVKKDEEKIVEKEFPADFKYSELAGKKVKIKVKVTDVKEKDIPELDDDLAQDINEKFENLADLKADVRKKLEESLEQKVKEDKTAQMIEQIVKTSKIDLPESMVKYELEMKWHQMLMQFGNNEQFLIQQLSKDNKGKEDFMTAWRPATEEGIKSSLVVEELAKIEKIEVTPEDIEEEIKKIADNQNMSTESIKEQLISGKMMDSLNFNIRNQKLFTQLLKNTTIKAGKKVTYLEYIQGKPSEEDEKKED